MAQYIPPSRTITLEPGRYWFTIVTGDYGGVARNFDNGTPGNWYGNADDFADGSSEQFGPGVAGNGTISAALLYRPGSAPTGFLGRTDVATRPSTGLKPNFIRWSAFGSRNLARGHYSEEEELGDQNLNFKLTGLHAYLDGLGGASGSQQVRMVIYGLHTQLLSPDSIYKIAQSEDVTIPAGQRPSWVHFKVPSVPLTSNVSQYYIGIQTGDTAGVIRDYGDRRLGINYMNTLYGGPLEAQYGDNWFGTPDDYADGASDLPDPVTLASIGPREGTLSVYATYSMPVRVAK